MKSVYIELIAVVERVHRQCLEVVKAELDRAGVRDLNNVQALILFNVGREELSVGELTQRGYYLGSNVSYNVKKMVENGYLIQTRSLHDRRSFHVKASEKGLKICDLLDHLFEMQASGLRNGVADEAEIEVATRVLRMLQHYWATPQFHAPEAPYASSNVTI